jgi:hypothetical protein
MEPVELGAALSESVAELVSEVEPLPPSPSATDWGVGSANFCLKGFLLFSA